jgi:hypothetical protein
LAQIKLSLIPIYLHHIKHNIGWTWIMLRSWNTIWTGCLM